VILYIDASFLDKIKVFVVPYEGEQWAAAQTRANTVFAINDPAQIPPEGKLDNECNTCPFQRSCAIVTNGTIPDDNSKLVDEALLEEFDPIAAEYEAKKEAAELAARAFEEIKIRVKDELVAAGTRRLGGKKAKRRWSMSWYSQDGQFRLSTRLLKDALGEDLDAYKEQGNPFDVLRVTFTDEKA
jgi:hypothetical protein